ALVRSCSRLRRPDRSSFSAPSARPRSDRASVIGVLVSIGTAPPSFGLPSSMVRIDSSGAKGQAAGAPAAYRSRAMTSAEALQRLLDGNARFAAGASQQQPDPTRLRELAEGQHPFATVLGCSDSRVPPEMVFDQGLGDVFVVRVAGNVVGTEILGSLGYALEYL